MVNIDQQTKGLIENNPVAFATADNNGHPNVIGVAYVKVVASDKVLITDNYMKQAAENVSKNPNVCLAIWDKNWSGCKIVGTAEYFFDGEWAEYVKKMPDNEGLPAKGAILITVEKLIRLH